MVVSTSKALLPYDIQTVWDTVTSPEHYGWRSDISRVEILSETRFVEHTSRGYATTFTVTAMEPCRRWAFDLENDNITGRWTGLFTARGSHTEIRFTEEVTAKKWFMKPFVKAYLKKQQARYLADLRRALL